MKFIVDLIILAIFIVTIFVFAKKGFVFALVKVVGFVGAFVVATGVGNFLSDVVYNKVIEPNIVSAVMEKVDNGINSVADSTYEALPEFIQKNGELFGLTKENFALSFPSGIVAESDIENILEKTVEPILSSLLSTLITLIAFAVLMFVVGFLSKFLNKIFSFSVVGKLNKILGGVIGVPIGIVFSLLFCLLLNLVISFVPEGFWIFTADRVNSSTLYNLLISVIN